MKKAIVLLFLLLMPALSADDIVAITSKQNPTIKIQASGLSQEAMQGVISNIKTCGWFTLSEAQTTNYTLKLQANGPKVTVNILDISGNLIPKGSYIHDISSLKGSWIQHRLVDEVIGRVYTPTSKVCSSRIAFCGTRRGVKEIYTIDFDGRNLNQETNYRTITVEPAWSPDNRFISYTVYGRQNANLIQKDLHTRQHRLISHFKGLNSSAAFHPKGDKFVLTLSKDNNVDLFLMPVGNPRQSLALTRDSNIESSPSWSPDGNKICYVSASISNGKVSSPKLYVMDLQRKKAFPLFRDGVERVSPDWSRSSNLVVYCKRMGRQYVVAVCDPSNPTSEKVLTQTAGDWEAPSWAPDGRHIVCSRNLGGRTDIYIIDSVFGFQRKISLIQNGKPYFDKMSLPAWSNLY